MMISAKLSIKIWQNLLPAPTERQLRKIAFLGVGNEFNGDDSAGVEFARRVAPHFDRSSRVMVIEAGLAPQNFSGSLRRFQPEYVVIIDAADMGQQVGETAIVETSEIDGLSCSTHTFPLSMLAKYLKEEIGCQVSFVGIQPGSTLPFTPITPAVQQSIEKLASSLLQFLSEV